MMQRDYSTLNLKALAKLQKYSRKPPSYHISMNMGMGCYLDPPGYPSYFLQQIYTEYGNDPYRGPQHLIWTPELHYRIVYSVVDREPHQVNLRKLWLPLPLEHERTQLWVRAMLRHFKGGYYRPGETEYGQPKIGFWDIGDFRTKIFVDDPRFSDTWRDAAKAEIATYNMDLQVQWTQIAIPENHVATCLIKKYYPEYPYNFDLVPVRHEGDWWETYDHKPTPEECPGSNGQKHSNMPTWCQMCGWRKEDDTH
jgi:hypothetical protein